MPSNINWADYPESLRQRIIEADPELAADLELWQEGSVAKQPRSLEERNVRSEEIRKELLATARKEVYGPKRARRRSRDLTVRSLYS